jgi:2-polyprenyl-3-methyl-5-hydroxy-6-metoxy-1,4-benzoquinol methylase
MNDKWTFYNANIAPFFRKYSIPLKIFLFVRWLRTPYQKFVEHLPEKGTCLDLGCGHGLLTITAAVRKKDLSVIGIDHDGARLGWWGKARRKPANLSFICESFVDYLLRPGQKERHSALLAIDVFHYFDYSMQETMIEGITRSLGETGVFIMREINPESGVSSGFNYLYERIVTRIGFTKGENVFLRTVAAWKSLLSRNFSVEAIPCASLPFSDVLFVCRKRAFSCP